MALAKTRRYACVVALGAIVRGETPHFEYVASEAASGLQLAGDRDRHPRRVRRADGRERSSRARRGSSRAADAVRSALEMADLFARLRASALSTALIALRLRRYNARPMSKVCSVCGKRPGFGNHRSHSMVATKRRFNPNLQRVRMLVNGVARARVRLHPLPQGRQGAEGRLAAGLNPGRRHGVALAVAVGAVRRAAAGARDPPTRLTSGPLRWRSCPAPRGRRPGSRAGTCPPS